VAIGGPPHSGKSVLAHSLDTALKQHEGMHYLLRAYPPDGEGNWFLEGDQEAMCDFRIKGATSEGWLPLLKRDIDRRQVPLLVDLGGNPTPEQETLLDGCTHAILLTPDEEARRVWTRRMEEHGLIILADLHSAQEGEGVLTTREPVLQGTLTGLERWGEVGGPAFEALTERLTDLFSSASVDLRRRHLNSAPVELAVDLQRLAAHLGMNPRSWKPQDLPAILDYLPPGCPLALYGAGPNWLYAAVALQALPQAFYSFDPRCGWVEIPKLKIEASQPGGSLTFRQESTQNATVLMIELPNRYLDYEELTDVIFPQPQGTEGGLILDGKLPLWLWTALARSYDARAPWLAVLQPQIGGAVVVASHVPGVRVGEVRGT
jgi:CRISPR-associated protein Csx3